MSVTRRMLRIKFSPTPITTDRCTAITTHPMQTHERQYRYKIATSIRAFRSLDAAVDALDPFQQTLTL